VSDTVIVAMISGGSSALVAITALILNYRGFSSIDARFGSVDARFAAIEARLGMIQTDLKEFYKLLHELDKRVSKIEDKQ
jgi:hypothetical protein